jgi:hypothetical protein
MRATLTTLTLTLALLTAPTVAEAAGRKPSPVCKQTPSIHQAPGRAWTSKKPTTRPRQKPCITLRPIVWTVTR